MRNKRFWKAFGLSISAVLILVLLFVVGFIFNPFEGSLPDMRDAVPRDVDFFLRKTDLAEDFADFPEPHFWQQFSDSSSWRTLEGGPIHRDLQANLQLDRALEEIRAAIQQTRDNTGGFVDPVADAVGREVIVAGRLDGRSLDQVRWCLYTRVSWKVRAGWGLKNIGVLQSALAGAGIQVQDEDDMLVFSMPGNPQPIYAARYLDCLMISNDRDLMQESLDLVEGIGQGEPFGRSSIYVDGISKPIQSWENRANPFETNAVEFYLRPQTLLPFQTLQRLWPDAGNLDSMNERVLAAFINLNAWRFLTGSLLFERDSLSVLARVELNRNEHTPFQGRFFQAEPQDRSRWLDPFLRMVPESACACAALRMPAGEFLQEMYRALDSVDQNLLDEGLRRTGEYQGMRDLIERIDLALLPRTGFVFSKNIPDPQIPVVAISPMPQVAWVFWVRPGMAKPLEEFQDVMRRHFKTFQFEQAYEMPVITNATDKILELTHRQIPATGEIAMILFDQFFVISNSGPLIRQMFETRFGGGRGSIMEGPYMEIFGRELPNAVNGFVFLMGRQLDEVLVDYRNDIDFMANQTPDPEWMVRNRPSAEDQVRRSKYQQYGSISAIPASLRNQFDVDVDAYLETLWVSNTSRFTSADRESLAQAMAFSKMFSAAYFQVMLEPSYINLTARFLLDYR
jgi:hypothetical protein